MYLVFPRAAAIAERLWSPKWVNDAEAAQPRLIHHRCETFVKRGIMAMPIRPDYCPYVYVEKTSSPMQTILIAIIIALGGIIVLMVLAIGAVFITNMFKRRQLYTPIH